MLWLSPVGHYQILGEWYSHQGAKVVARERRTGGEVLHRGMLIR